LKEIALHHKSRTCIWSRLNIFLSVLIAAGICILVLYRNLPWIKDREMQDARVSELEGQIDSARMLNKRLTREVTLLQTNPEYLAIYARDRLSPGYMKQGETIFRIDPKQ
jgi:cell division protein FtsB